MRCLELKIPPVLLVILSALLMWLSQPYFPLYPLSFTMRITVFLLMLATGFVIALIGVLAFKKAQTTVNPIKPETSSALVNIGIYKITRNPMYVGMALALIGWAFFLGNPISLVFVVAFVLYMTYFQIKPEEKMLTKLFQQQYIDYCKQVKRWI
ncbi:membrane protein [Thalassotalea insulae]|uniref:Membrane protein n=1 Tax=Thalassotalea insulae TaxID=2056778 RepID=A0ABQ6GSU8_9GAMM|nr:isoprenylcysteine carboxylmethyltransferase family protein [Thalassotalea insulae]GLX78234.1 membrane protein [Thalassotalea insulae]